MARTRPPKETMLTAPAPALASGTLELEVGLLEPPVEPEPEEPEPEEPEALAAGPLGEAPLPVGAGTVALPPLGGVTMGVTPGAPGAMGVAVGTTTVPEASGTETPGTTGADGETAGTEDPGVGTTEGMGTGVAGGAWIWPSEIWEMGWTGY
jgi:hypothetical protein